MYNQQTAFVVPTAQELFDNAALGIASQGYRRSRKDGTCVLEDYNGRRCAIGWSVPALPGQMSNEFSTMTGTQHKKLFHELMTIHDCYLDPTQANTWKLKMSRLALKCGLDDSVLWWDVPVSIP